MTKTNFVNLKTGEKISVYVWSYTSQTYTFMVSDTIDGEMYLIDKFSWRQES
jgi:hypothetical protein